MFCHHTFENRDSDILLIIYNYYNEAQNPAIMKVSNKWRQIARVQVVTEPHDWLFYCGKTKAQSKYLGNCHGLFFGSF